MKINGVEISKVAEPKTMVIPMGDSKTILKYKPVYVFDEFEKLCPEPKPPEVLKPGGVRTTDPQDAEYLKLLDGYASAKTGWMIMESLSPTEGIEWSTVVVSDPTTWSKISDELSATFGAVYANSIVRRVIEASGFNSDLIDKATEDFLSEASV